MTCKLIPLRLNELLCRPEHTDLLTWHEDKKKIPGMDIDPFKLLAAIGTLFAIGDKLYTHVKNWREKSGRERFKQLKKMRESNQSGIKKNLGCGIETFLIPQRSIS